MPLAESSHRPRCTYRVQLHQGFTFGDLEKLSPYFKELGISDFYLSPIFEATPGSSHGYDVTDYRKINPELGGGEGFDQLSRNLHAAGFSLLIDFVPNHMGIAGLLNGWWRDVLENGRLSPYASFFDIRWRDQANAHPRVLVPALEDQYGKVLAQGKIRLTYAEEFSLGYGDIALPLRPSSYGRILEPLAQPAGAQDGHEAIAAIVAGFAGLPPASQVLDVDTARKRAETVDGLKKELREGLAARPALRARLETRLQTLNGVPGNPASFDELHELIESQHYRLARWQAGAHEINYRRFFAIDSLVGLHIEKADVFRESHELLGQLILAGKVDGLRIDHIDGLRQPEEYLNRLQSLARPDSGRPLYVLVEKILARNEKLAAGWATHGTTGYEFIAELADLLVAATAEARFTDIYERFTGDTEPYEETVYHKKRLIIAEMFYNAVSNLGAELVEILAGDRNWRDLTRHELTTAVSELMANLPVYRTYRRSEEPATAADRRVIEQACQVGLLRNPRSEPAPFEFVRDLLIGTYPPPEAPAGLRETLLHWVLTFQQYTGAVMAKSVEDTAFYTYTRLIALNEVGGNPGCFGASIERFHAANGARLAECPHSMLASSTHDTKLSEDVRARLYALSELPDEWEGWLEQWRDLTIRHTTMIEGRAAPDARDVYRFYQVLLGAWPLEEAELDDVFRRRLREHFRKAVSEAKRHTSILQTNHAYLDACDHFVDHVLHPESGGDFLASFVPSAHRIARLGMVNSLAQVVLKCTVPGVPDFYQGNEIWDFSLVDPDNRRDVDFGRRQALATAAAASAPAELMKSWRDGAIKLRTMQVLLRFRGEHPELFASGDYRPVSAEGSFGEQVVAFTRSHAGVTILVLVPRLSAKLGSPPLSLAWDDTRLAVPVDAAGWTDLFGGRLFAAHEPLFVRDLFAELPFAVLHTGLAGPPTTP